MVTRMRAVLATPNEAGVRVGTSRFWQMKGLVSKRWRGSQT